MLKSEINVKQETVPLFLSSRLQSDKEKRIYFKTIAWAGREGFNPIFTIGISAPSPKPEDISKAEQECISKSECFIAITCTRGDINGFAHSYSVPDEINIAKAQNKPIYLFLEKGVRGEGGIKYKADKILTFESWEIEAPEGEYRVREELRRIQEEIVRLHNLRDATDTILSKTVKVTVVTELPSAKVYVDGEFKGIT
jgi:hypothetical protein